MDFEKEKILTRILKIHDGIFDTLKRNDCYSKKELALDYAIREINTFYLGLLDSYIYED